MSKEALTFALSKGRIFDEAAALLKKAGIEMTSDVNSRKLVIPDTQGRFRFFIVKPVDVPTYVEYGVADVGIAGRDVLLESNADVHQPLDLRIGLCTLLRLSGLSGDTAARWTGFGFPAPPAKKRSPAPQRKRSR